MKIKNFFKAWNGYSVFRRLDEKERELVFYAECHNSWPFFQPIIESLKQAGRQICYVTSSDKDPILVRKDPHIKSYYIGDGIIRTIFFTALQAKVMVMTMPDLGGYYIKRSKFPVHYMYAFHSIVSTHMIYKQTAFDEYDTIFCVGSHHIDEIRARERIYGLKQKNLVEHGYGRLDSIIRNRPAGESGITAGKINVLIAPSWGKSNILEFCGEQLIEILLNAGFKVTVRPHPMAFKKSRHVIESLLKRFKNEKDFVLEENVVSEESLHESDIMISDWSGTPIEYAFGLEKPVIFIDVPRKVNNEEYEKLNITPLEVSIREKIGKIIHPENLEDLPASINELVSRKYQIKEEMQNLSRDYVFNIGNSGKAAAVYIIDFLQSIANSR